MRVAHACLAVGLAASAFFGWVAGCAATPDPARVSGEGGTTAPIGSGDPDASSGSLPPSGDNGDPLDPFAAGVTYYSTTIAPSAADAHRQAGGADAGAPPPTDNGDCMSCHDGSTEAQPLAIGGIVYQTPGTPCAGTCEVLFVDGADPPHRVKVTTAADGTFSLLPGDYGTVSAETHVGVRRGQQTYLMPVSEDIDDGAGTLRGCGSANCHVEGREGLIVLANQ